MRARDCAVCVLLGAMACSAWAGAWAQEGRDEALARYGSSLQPGEAVLSYEVEAQGIYLQVITSAWIGQPIFLPYPREELLSDVLALRKAVETPYSFDALEHFSSTLYTKLVQPGLETLAQQGLLDATTTLVIIPSGPLWYVPFSALLMTDRPPIGQGLITRYPYLVERYSLVFLPSLQELLQLGEVRSDGRRSSAVMSFHPKETVRVHPDLLLYALSQLPGAEPARTYEGEQANTEAFRQELAQARYLVLLVSTINELSSPWTSSFVFADTPYELWRVAATSAQGMELVVIPTHDAVSDRLFRLSQPLLQAPLTLATLEVVEVAPPRLPPLDGSDASIWYIAFRAAGVQVVLMTSWCPNVLTFQDLFYLLCLYRAAGHNWAEALARAQRDLIQRGAFVEYPWFWAFYRLIGRWR